MGLLLSTRRALLGAVETYNDKVMRTSPVAYWPQNETAGTAAVCLTNTAMNGTYTGVTLANDNTGPFGTPAPWFDGATSVNNVFTAALVAAFNGSAGSMMAWAKVNAAGIWTDGNYHCVMDLGADGNNYIDLFKWNTNNNLSWRYRAAGATSQRLKAGMTTTDWMLLAITWDDVANEMKAFFNGTQEGATVAIANNWAGALGAIRCVIGASTSAPVSFPWHGGVGPCAIWDRVLPPAEMATMYT